MPSLLGHLLNSSSACSLAGISTHLRHVYQSGATTPKSVLNLNAGLPFFASLSEAAIKDRERETMVLNCGVKGVSDRAAFVETATVRSSSRSGTHSAMIF